MSLFPLFVLFFVLFSYSILAVTAEGEMTSWGLNENGQLGQGHIKNVWLPKKIGVPGGHKAITCVSKNNKNNNNNSKNEKNN
ncbi:RCC1 domain-containing protein [Patescibacteria group bacterium]|nr:RCC1 domain-containing protein [Patescibacteria group bacterium]